MTGHLLLRQTGHVLLRCYRGGAGAGRAVALRRRLQERLLLPCLSAAAAHVTQARNHNNSSSIKGALSPSLLPLTTREPRLPKSPQEQSERLQPLADFWNTTPDDLISSSSFRPTKDQLTSLLSLPLPNEVEYYDIQESSASYTFQQVLSSLYTAANVICTQYHDNKVHHRGLLEFSNICRCNCYYCGIRRGNKQHLLERFALDEDTIMSVARWCAEQQYGSIMLQSGEVVTSKRVNFVSKIVQRIVQETGLGISLSVGELPDEYYQQLRDAGAKRYLLRIETSNPNLFATLHPPEQTFEARLDRLRALKRIGFMLGTGVMIGLPGQTRQDLAEDLLFFLREDVDMIGMGPYILQRGTPTGDLWQSQNPDLFAALLAKEEGNETKEQTDLLNANAASMFELTTRMLALARLLLKDVNIAATTALQTIHPTGREVALMRGANILMPIVTPTSHRAHYQLYEGKVCVEESAKQCRACLEGRVSAAGKRIAYGEHGDPPHALQRIIMEQER
jgi:biotin synthase